MNYKSLFKIFLFFCINICYSQNTTVSENGISFSYSNDWRIYPYIDNDYTLLSLPSKFNLKHQIAFQFSIKIDSTKSKLNDYYETFKKDISERDHKDWKFEAPKKGKFDEFDSYSTEGSFIVRTTKTTEVSGHIKIILIKQNDRIISLTSVASNYDYVKQREHIDKLYKSFKLIETKELIPKNKKITYLKSKELFYNSRYFQTETFHREYYIPLFDFKDNHYSNLRITDKRFEKEKWVTYTLKEYTPLKKGHIIYDSESKIISQKVTSHSKLLYSYDKEKRVDTISYFIEGKKQDDIMFNYKYPDNKTTIINNGIVIKTNDKFNRVIKEIKDVKTKYNSLKVTNEYTYNKKNLVKKIKRNFKWTDTSEEYNFHLTYKFNEFGDWSELYITKSDINDSEKKPYRLIKRVFE